MKNATKPVAIDTTVVTTEQTAKAKTIFASLFTDSEKITESRSPAVSGRAYVTSKGKNMLEFDGITIENIHENTDKDGKVISFAVSFRIPGPVGMVVDGTGKLLNFPNGLSFRATAQAAKK